MTQVLPRTRAECIQIIPVKGLGATHGCWWYWGCRVVKFLSDAIPPMCPWKLLPFCLFTMARFQGATTKFSVIIQGQSTQRITYFFWRSHRHTFTMALITASWTPPQKLWKPPQRKGDDGVPIDKANQSIHVSRRWVASQEHACQDGRSTSSTLLAFQAKSTDQLLKIHPQYYSFPTSEGCCIFQASLKERDWQNHTQTKAAHRIPWLKQPSWCQIPTAFSWVGVSSAKAHARATRRNCSGLAVVRRRCKQSPNTGLCWGLGWCHASPPRDSWDCSGESSRQVWESQPASEVDPAPFPTSLPADEEDCHQLSSLLPAACSTKVRWRSLFTSVERSS